LRAMRTAARSGRRLLLIRLLTRYSSDCSSGRCLPVQSRWRLNN
jgi:hypothetical protein